MHQYHISTLRRERMNLKETSEWKLSVVYGLEFGLGADDLSERRRSSDTSALAERGRRSPSGPHEQQVVLQPQAAEASLITLHSRAVQLSRTQLKRTCCKGERARSPQTPARLKCCRCTEIRSFANVASRTWNWPVTQMFCCQFETTFFRLH